MFQMDKHFSAIAENYRQLRSTESAPIKFIASKIKFDDCFRAIDIGCGCGRYSLALKKSVTRHMKLLCMDRNLAMLKQLIRYFRRNGVVDFMPFIADAGQIPLKDNSISLIVTFNAIHHFAIMHFLKEVWRLLRKNGLCFIYTRTRTQNKRNIWGRYFPLFWEKESRLYEVQELCRYIKLIPQLKIVQIKNFYFKKRASLSKLIELAKRKHYSTFAMYSREEFERCLAEFIENLQEHFHDLNCIEWVNENVMFVIRKI